MNIERGTEKDILEVSRLWRNMSKELAVEEIPDTELWRELTIATMRNGVYHLFILKDEDKIVGFSDCYIIAEPSIGGLRCIGRHIYVEPEYRKTTYAGLLYRRVVQEAKDSGADDIEFMCHPSTFSKWNLRGYHMNYVNMTKNLRR
jgi:GNAT superfamily N-acetyltransferase